ncbi:hypothetical protein ACIRL2_41340 [Embleya sp. NPDC127516]|uniref:hypothetical protein n=1 Tax=Embleya sp. NPDC127516 TaxID=3363990 RepID=UPI003821F9FB
MPNLSSLAVGVAAELAVGAFSKPDLKILFMKAGLDGHMPDNPYGKGELVTDTVEAARRKRAHDELHEFVRLVGEKLAPKEPEVIEDTPFWKLREAVRAGGFDLVAEYATAPGPGSGESLKKVRLLPLDEPHAPLSEVITAVQADFNRLSMTNAAEAYEEAVDCLIRKNYRAANGQMRAMFEAALTHFADSKGFGSTAQGVGGSSITYLIDQGHLPLDDGGMYLRGLWKITHTNGPHPGTTDTGEAYFRAQALTSAVRYLIDRFAPAP